MCLYKNFLIFVRKQTLQTMKNIFTKKKFTKINCALLCLLATTFQVTSCASTNQDEAIDAYVYIKESPQLKPYNPMIFGGFVEHFNKQVYGGIFNPGSTLSDKHGFRCIGSSERIAYTCCTLARWLLC